MKNAILLVFGLLLLIGTQAVAQPNDSGTYDSKEWRKLEMFLAKLNKVNRAAQKTKLGKLQDCSLEDSGKLLKSSDLKNSDSGSCKSLFGLPSGEMMKRDIANDLMKMFKKNANVLTEIDNKEHGRPDEKIQREFLDRELYGKVGPQEGADKAD